MTSSLYSIDHLYEVAQKLGKEIAGSSSPASLRYADFVNEVSEREWEFAQGKLNAIAREAVDETVRVFSDYLVVAFRKAMRDR